MDFQEIVPVSALKQENTEELIKCIMKYLPYGPAFYDEDTITDQPQRQIVAELIREKALRCLDEEIPHGIAVTIEKMKWRKSSKGTIVDIEATIICERESHKGIIIGKQGTMLRKIGQSARRDIEEMLEEKVNLQLWVKVRRDWRDSDLLLKITDIIRKITNRKLQTVNPNYRRQFRGHRMKNVNYWDQFLSTGKIEDYLAYRKEAFADAGKQQKEGAETHAGTGQGYRDGARGITCRRDG